MRISRSDWLLLFLDAKGGTYEADQVRIMKGLFLLSRSTLHPASELYIFGPYDYGPFDAGVYQDLQSMRLLGFIESHAVPGSSRRLYELTEKGRQRVHGLQPSLDWALLRPIEDAKRYVTTRSFDQLLQDLYADYPAYAQNSIARVARQTG